MLADVVAAAIKHVAPASNASARVHNVRLHDDKSTYTGVYSRGGPVNFDGLKDLSQITNRKPADHRGVALPTRATTPRRGSSDAGPRSGRLPMSPSAAHALNAAFSMPSDAMSLTGSVTPPLGPRRRSVKSVTPSSARLQGWDDIGVHHFAAHRHGQACLEAHRLAPGVSDVGRGVYRLDAWLLWWIPWPLFLSRGQCCAGPLRRVFISFALFGKGHLGPDVRTSDIKMDSKAFAKTMKEAGVMDSRLNTTRVDLCFTKAADKARLDTCRW
jgi:p25-alpha